HLDPLSSYVRDHRVLDFAEGHVNSEGRKDEGVDDIGIEFDVIIPARQALTEAGEVHGRNRIEEAALVSLSEAGRPPLERCPAATLETVPPQELRIARPAVRVPETDHVDSVRPVRRAQGGLLGKLRELTGRA